MAELLAVATRRQQRHDGQRGKRNRSHDRDWTPPRCRQPAVGKHQRDNGRADEQRRPRSLVNQHRPFGARQRARVLQSRVVRVWGRNQMRRQHEPIREQKPPDRVAAAVNGEHQPDPARGQPRGPPRHPDPGLLRVRAGQDIQQRRERNARDRQARGNPGGHPAKSHCANHLLNGASSATVVAPEQRHVLALAQVRCSQRCARPVAHLGSSGPANSRKAHHGQHPQPPRRRRRPAARKARPGTRAGRAVDPRLDDRLGPSRRRTLDRPAARRGRDRARDAERAGNSPARSAPEWRSPRSCSRPSQSSRWWPTWPPRPSARRTRRRRTVRACRRAE